MRRNPNQPKTHTNLAQNPASSPARPALSSGPKPKPKIQPRPKTPARSNHCAAQLTSSPRRPAWPSRAAHSLSPLTPRAAPRVEASAAQQRPPARPLHPAPDFTSAQHTAAAHFSAPAQHRRSSQPDRPRASIFLRTRPALAPSGHLGPHDSALARTLFARSPDALTPPGRLPRDAYPAPASGPLKPVSSQPVAPAPPNSTPHPSADSAPSSPSTRSARSRHARSSSPTTRAQLSSPLCALSPTDQSGRARPTAPATGPHPPVSQRAFPPLTSDPGPARQRPSLAPRPTHRRPVPTSGSTSQRLAPAQPRLTRTTQRPAQLASARVNALARPTCAAQQTPRPALSALTPLVRRCPDPPVPPASTQAHRPRVAVSRPTRAR